MKVKELIAVLSEVDPELDILFLHTHGVVQSIKSVSEVSYKGFVPETFIGLCCSKHPDSNIGIVKPVYSAQK